MHENLFGGVLLASMALAAVSGLLFAEPTTKVTTGPTTKPAAGGANGWDGAWFNYKGGRLVVEETTPSKAPVDWRQLPATPPAHTPAPVAPAAAVKPLAYEHMNLTHLRFRDVEGADVPALL